MKEWERKKKKRGTTSRPPPNPVDPAQKSKFNYTPQNFVSEILTSTMAPELLNNLRRTNYGRRSNKEILDPSINTYTTLHYNSSNFFVVF